MPPKYDFAGEVRAREVRELAAQRERSVHAGNYVPMKAVLVRRTPVTPDELKRDAKFAKLGIKPEHIAPENAAAELNQRFTHKAPLMFHITAFTISTKSCSEMMLNCFMKYRDKIYVPNKRKLIVK